MIPHIKLRARALQQQHRALFAAVFLFRAAVTLLPVAAATCAALLLRNDLRVFAFGGCAVLLVFLRGALSLGEARVFSALVRGERTRFRRCLSAFRVRDLLRAGASYALSGAMQTVFGALLCAPACVCVFLLFRSLERGLPALTALLFSLGTAAAAAATVPILFCVHALFLPRAYYLAHGCGVLQSVTNCLRIEDGDLHRLLRLQRSFFGWRALCLLLVPLPFVWGYAAQSRALLFSAMNLRPMA